MKVDPAYPNLNKLINDPVSNKYQQGPLSQRNYNSELYRQND